MSLKDKKIVLITTFCSPYRYKLFDNLSHKLNIVFYFFIHCKNKTKEDIKHLEIISDHSSFNYLPLIKIFEKLFKNRYDIIIKCTNNKWSFLGTFIIAKLINAKFIIWHTMWYYPKTLQYRLFSWLLLKILKDYSDAIVVYGEHGKKFLIDKGINSEKIFIAWQTVDNEVFGRDVSEQEVQEIFEKYNLKKDTPIILYVGRIIELKGIEYLLEASKILKDSGKRFTLLFVGDGKMRTFVENFCEQNSIDYRITGILNYKNLVPFYKMAKVLILPSITTNTSKELWGLVVNEAFNQGCPVVVTDAVGAGVGGLVNHGVNGFIVPERNAQALANAIEKILSDNIIYSKISQNAQEEIKQWNYERQTQGFLDAVKYSLKERH